MASVLLSHRRAGDFSGLEEEGEESYNALAESAGSGDPAEGSVP